MSAGLAFEVFTLFPAAIESFLAGGLMGKAVTQGLVSVHCTDYREFTDDRHRTVDDTPYGGGAGMVMKIEPVVAALETVTAKRGPMHRILVTPSAPRFDQRVAERLAQVPRIGLLCGRYEGIDDRVRESYVDECLSIGDFVLNGGEVAALTIIEAVARLREGVLGNPDSVVGESFTLADQGPWLEHPHYTRPVAFRGHEVPKVLLSGDHQAIARWRAEQACGRTWALRPDLRSASGGALDRLVCVAVQGRAACGGLGDLLRSLREKTDVPLALVGRGLGEEALAPSDLRARDLKELVRRLRRTHDARPQVVALVAERGALGSVHEPGHLLDLLAIRGDADRSRPLVLLAGLEGEVPKGVDAVFAPLSSSPLQEGLELAPSAQMIESSQPKTAPSVPTLIAAAIRRLRHPHSP